MPVDTGLGFAHLACQLGVRMVLMASAISLSMRMATMIASTEFGLRVTEAVGALSVLGFIWGEGMV